MMRVTVLLFASYADALGASSVELVLPAGATVRDAVDRLTRMPGGELLPPSPAVAVNQSYASAERFLSPGDEVAVIPPVAGG